MDCVGFIEELRLMNKVGFVPCEERKTGAKRGVLAMKKGLVLLGIMLFAAPGMAATLSLPPVNLDGCTKWFDIETDAQTLISTIAGFGVEGIPSYDEADLENGMDGDGVPDKYQMALLAALLCKGNATVQGQYDANMALYTGLVDDLLAVFAILLGNPLANPAIPPAADRLTEVAGILAPLAPDPVPQEVVDAINSAAAELADFTGDLPPEINATVLPVLGNTLRDLKEAVAALMGLDSEIQASVLDLLTSEILGQVTAIREQVVGIVAAVQPLIGPPLTTEQQAAMTALIADVNTIVEALDNTLALTEPGAIAIYGVTAAKTTSEPFSALGDYDQNGYSNLTTYNTMKDDNGGNPPDVAEYVAAASNPFSPVNPNVPVAGLFGLAALAGACLTGGAFALRRK